MLAGNYPREVTNSVASFACQIASTKTARCNPWEIDISVARDRLHVSMAPIFTPKEFFNFLNELTEICSVCPTIIYRPGEMVSASYPMQPFDILVETASLKGLNDIPVRDGAKEGGDARDSGGTGTLALNW